MQRSAERVVRNLRTLGTAHVAGILPALALLATLTVVGCGDDSPSSPDIDGPERVHDLTAAPSDSGEVLLSWTAPDDAGSGSAAAYEIRYLPADLQGGTWNDAQALAEVPAPGPPGSGDAYLVRGLPILTAWAFALRSVDAAGNESPTSNVAYALVPTGSPRMVAEGATAAAISPAGDRIAFVRPEPAPGIPGGPGGLFIADASGANPVRVIDEDDLGTPSWSPDGSRVVVSADPPGADGEIWVVPAGGGALVVVGAEGVNRAPRWSPDGSVLYMLSDRSGSIEIWSVPVDGTGAEQVTTRGPVESFDISPNGGQIVYAASPNGTPDLWTVDLGTGNAFSLVAGAGDRSAPVWSPDGEWIAFTEVRNEIPEIHVVPWSGGPSTRLAVNARHPSWSPDSRRIAYAGQPAPGSLNIISISGGTPILVAADPVTGSPAWSVDGTWILYPGRTNPSDTGNLLRVFVQ